MGVNSSRELNFIGRTCLVSCQYLACEEQHHLCLCICICMCCVVTSHDTNCAADALDVCRVSVTRKEN
jgi:hypothetical protein